MWPIKPLQRCIRRLFPLFMSVVCGYFALIFAIISIIKTRTAFFQVKRRNYPPDCLNDPSFGSHQLIQLKSIKLHMVSKGDPNNTLLLFLHGWPDFWYSWRHQIKEFSDQYFVVAVDQRGYGDSEKPIGIENYTIDKLVEDVKQLLEALNQKNVIIVGHDWGGQVAWNFAASYGHLVDRLVIINSPHPLAYDRIVKKSWKQYFISLYMYFFNLPLIPELLLLSNDLHLFKYIYASGDGHSMLTQQDLEAYKYVFSKYNSLTGPLNYYRAVIRRYRTARPDNFRIRVKSLIIWGKQDIGLIPQLAEAFHFVDNLVVKYIDDCGHFAQMDRPLIVNQYIREFLNND